jgi:hypothetical protein
VMVIANCDRFTSLAVNEVTGNVVKLLKDMLYTLNLVPLTTVPQTIPGEMDRKHLAETVSRMDAGYGLWR